MRKYCIGARNSGAPAAVIQRCQRLSPTTAMRENREVAQEPAYRPTAKAPHVEKQSDRHLPALKLGRERGFEPSIFRGGQPPARADADEGVGAGFDGEHVSEMPG